MSIKGYTLDFRLKIPLGYIYIPLQQKRLESACTRLFTQIKRL